MKRTNDKKRNRPLVLQNPCELLSQQLIMGWDGKTILCCEDYYAEHITGRFPAESLREIWHGSALSGARKLHETGRFGKIPLCKHCDSVVFHEYDEEIVETKGRKSVVKKELPTMKATV